MTNLIRLRVPAGAADAEISHGTESYRPFLDDPSDPDSDTHVLVPRHAADHFTHNAGFETVTNLQAPAPAGTAILSHRDGPTWPDGSDRIINGIKPRRDGNGRILNEYPVPVDQVPGLFSHGLDAPEIIRALKSELEEKLGVVDATVVEGIVAEAVKKAVAQAEAERDAAVQRAETAEHAIVEVRAASDAHALKTAQEIRALKAEVDAKERQITELLNKEQIGDAEGRGAKVDKKK